ncbi:cytoskeleton assembly control protein [Coprinopsis cinerea okayama7|uniref:Cytoskeleton assembly control protein n=1 Tax=Coprinopsis cinerea (strain Okayama-7 / 130 / ATCC MYA-4618 / FGSC 9003) TaxID=240176 RepID=A8N2F9_COPC7|nr:cytoskeleton assembly control protein [Coprinopsis cinerea okayama7\|eukprot:XP_001829132.1 cytoskeleton assembly control protein [Coprinopsis cinerea okayama7\
MHYPTRPVDKDKAEAELAIHIKKATSPEETAPKQKHVRKCIVYTWDYHSSMSFWSGLRVQPILSDEVQTFKALIMVHKVLQEGHGNTLKEAQGQTAWLETCARTVITDGTRGYGPLIKTYVQFILAKLRFHRLRPEFNGLFEYAEYITLKEIDDPNEGYETISDLMNLQDQIDSFQKLVFSHFRYSTNNECRISALVPLVKESWGIYRFIISMLRAMHRRATDVEALEPLRERFVQQHYNLRKFYYECSNLKYLTGLINVPKLGAEPPNLTDSGDAPDLPARPKTAVKSPSPPAEPQATAAEIDAQAKMLREYEEKQAALQAQREAEERQRLEMEAQQQREFEQRQREQAEAQRLAQEQLLQQQMMYTNQAAQQHASELERELLAMRGQYERDQIFLEQYDRRVKALEAELSAMGNHVGSQVAAKDELIKQLQDQVTLWRNKYEALAKLYSQLRTEHLDMLSKFKQLQLKANSAQESVDKMERMERDLKAKNLELADMLRERDRARFEVDRQKSSHKEEIDRLRRELNFANERAEDATRSKSSEVSSVLSRYNRQISELEDSLRSKQYQIDELLIKLDEASANMERIKEEKEQEILILQEGMDSTLQQLSEVQQNQGLLDETTNAQIDTLILDNRKKLNEIIDSILQAAVHKVDDAIYELESPAQAGNLNSTPEYTLSMIEKATNNATEFATIYNLYLSGEAGGDHVSVIKSANELAQSLADVLINTKGITRLASDDDAVDKLINVARAAGDTGTRFFENLQTYKLDLLQPAQRKEVAMRNNSQTRVALTKLSEVVDGLISKGAKASRANGDLGDIVEQEMLSAAKAIEAATERLQQLIARPKDSSRFSAVDLQVHDSILSSAMAITNAIGRLIKAATESQQEIVAQGRGSSTSQQFYKRNNRWTEGLISAAKAVAFATNLLIESADGVLSGTHSLEQLIVASNEVAAATAQLVAASRVKANLMSKTQERLEAAAKAVTEACKALVRQVKAISAREVQEEDVDYKNMAVLEFKKREMEQQVEILRLEKELGAARHRLGAMRRAGYHTDETD